MTPRKQTPKDLNEETDWKEYFEFPKYSADLWAAKFGHLIGSGDLRHYTFKDKEFEKWCHELFDILQSSRLPELRKTLLTAVEIKRIEKELNNW